MWLITPAFARFWQSHFASRFATSITSFLLPLLAITQLQANALEMGILSAAQETPVVLFSLLVGLLLDRVELRRLLLVALIGQALVVAFIAWVLFSPWASLGLLYAGAMLLGSAKLFVDLAGTTYLPQLVARASLLQANSRLQLSLAAERVAGPALAGLLARITPGLGFIVAVIGHALAAVLITRVKTTQPDRSAMQSTWQRDILSGFRVLFENHQLRAVIVSSCLGALSVGMFYALLIFSLIEVLVLTELSAGLIVALVGSATFATSFFVPRLSHVVGTGHAMIVGIFASTMGMMLHAWALNQAGVAVTAFGLVLLGAGTALFSINQITIRQAVTPAEYLGRVNATRRFVVFGFLPVGALLGGVLAEYLSVVFSVSTAAAIMLLSAVPLMLSPVKSLRLSNL